MRIQVSPDKCSKSTTNNFKIHTTVQVSKNNKTLRESKMKVKIDNENLQSISYNKAKLTFQNDNNNRQTSALCNIFFKYYRHYM